MEKTYKRASFKDMVYYGFGGIGSNIPFMLTMMFLMFFYTDHFGINAASVGGLFLVSRFVDAITDPIMGMIADRTKSKMGKYRPFLIVGGPLLGVLIVLLFSVPQLSDTGKLVYVYITYIMYSLISTVVNIPYHSLTPVLSEDPNQRTTVATTKQLLGIIGTVFVTVAALPLVEAFGNDASAWQKYAIIAGILTTIAFWVCAFGARKYDKMEIHNQYNNKTSHNALSIKDQLSLIYKNKALLMLMIAFGTDLVAFAGSMGVNIYYFMYAIKRPDFVAKIGMYGLGISVAVTLCIPFLAKTFGKKRLFIFGTTLLMILCAALYFTPFTSVTQVLIICVLLQGFGPLTGVVGWAMLADCVEYGEWKTGIRGAGTVSSQLTFVNKLGMAVGGLMAGVLLSASGYIAGADQTPETLEMMVRVKTWLPIVGYMCSLGAMFFYPITKEVYAKIVKENDVKRINAA